MKKLLSLLVAIVMANGVSARDISFTNEIGCGIQYSLSVLVDIIASCDTLYEGYEADRLIGEYDKEFPSSNPEEPAVLILIPDDDYFNVVFIQEDEAGEIMTLRIISEDGWLECDSEPYSIEFINLAAIISFVQHLNEVAEINSQCLH